MVVVILFLNEVSIQILYAIKESETECSSYVLIQNAGALKFLPLVRTTTHAKSNKGSWPVERTMSLTHCHCIMTYLNCEFSIWS